MKTTYGIINRMVFVGSPSRNAGLITNVRSIDQSSTPGPESAFEHRTAPEQTKRRRQPRCRIWLSRLALCLHSQGEEVCWGDAAEEDIYIVRKKQLVRYK
ncbi:hypothetical protein GJ744_007343 [Endocarpon pusillum]|uniref:Uncharacterized protein n=1 Tax=Endocarpon pusillum TaxID=364733 RepID=A0A8H7E597_9EURO|nr:hypothetical protein GJ744_007343 [Endocarpon pusillum]